MKATFKSDQFSKDIIAKREKDGVSMKTVQDQSGASLMQIYRAELGQMPRLEAYFMICSWLGKPMEHYFSTAKKVKNGKNHH